MIIPIKTIQLDQESKGHQYKRSLNSPLLKSKGVIALTAMMETLMVEIRQVDQTKLLRINPNTRSQKLVAKRALPS